MITHDRSRHLGCVHFGANAAASAAVDSPLRQRGWRSLRPRILLCLKLVQQVGKEKHNRVRACVKRRFKLLCRWRPVRQTIYRANHSQVRKLKTPRSRCGTLCSLKRPTNQETFSGGEVEGMNGESTLVGIKMAEGGRKAASNMAHRILVFRILRPHRVFRDAPDSLHVC